MLQLGQRPLTGSDADRKLFVNRTAELGHLQRAAQLDFNVLVLGERGIGLTSLLRQHQRYLEDADRPSHYAGAAVISDLPGLVETIRIAVTGRRLALYSDQPEPGESWFGFRVREADPDPLRELRDLREAESEAEPERGYPIIILDEMYEPALVHQLFGRYRDEVWQLPFRWLVCGLATRRSRYLEPPADAFFDSVLTIDPLDDAAARDLLQARLAAASVDDAEAALRIISECDRIVEQGRGNPRQILAAARDTVLRSPEETAAADRLVDTAATLGTTETLAVRHLLTNGPTSASDTRLLERLDVTRARATQVLRRLEDAGLVYGFQDKGGIGRPRKLYATRLSPEEAE